jgi:tetratricopeptide (TPR) repeat protein
MFRRSLLASLLAVCVPLMAVALIALLSGGKDRDSALIDAGYEALFQNRPREAEAFALELIDDKPESAAGLALAAEASAGTKEYVRVEEYLARLVECSLGADSQVQQQLFRLAETLINTSQLAMGERVLRFLVTESPMHVKGRRKLAELLAMTGRRHEARKHTLVVIATLGKPVSVHELVMAADDSNVFEDAATKLRTASAQVPSDPIAYLGVAWTEYQSNNLQAAESLCREALRYAPELLDAHALLGNVLLNRGDVQGLKAWHDRLPATADDLDEIWVVRGIWLRDEGNNESAARCFWEAIKRNPDHRLANLELGKLLSNLGDTDAAVAFLHRGDYLRRLRLEMNVFDSDQLRESGDEAFSLKSVTPRATTEAMKRISELLEELKREEEALGWATAAQALTPELAWPTIMMRRLAQTHQTLTASAANPALRINLSHLALSREMTSAVSKPPSLTIAGDSQVQFTDDAAEVGIRFTYFNSPHSEDNKSWPFEWPGGGSGVLDYDLDGWPDIYLPQGRPLMRSDDGDQYQDVLYRNQAPGRFMKATSQAGLGNRAFSHGCAVGDWDNDGFPDLYVCNLGQNRLYHNNGDGTFEDVTEKSGIQSDRWTTCAAIVDLNGDGFPELYEVNHMTKESAFTEMCMHGAVSMACQQGLKLEPEQDRLFVNAGNGSFSDVTQECGIVAPLGFGLGIVAADFSNRGQIDLFVANDGYANFYFANRTAQPGGRLELSESAVTSGIAFDPDGAPQACMGVATADTDHDGLLDIFVTNYYEESNAFYRQTGTEFFVDNARPSGLFAPSFALLGFGTQFIDGELDGLRDLIITNGDVDDFTEIGRPYHQRPQYIKSVGDAKFIEVAPETLGPFFEGEYLGRGLSRLDWNRDGREDCIISHLDSPIALLTNHTRNTGNFLAIRLRGVESARDAIGANVVVRSGEDSWSQSLTAGDGYMASNQRQLVFGLGNYQQVDSLTIHWPSGHTDEFSNIEVGNELMFVEGRSQFASLSAMTDE